MRRVPLASNAAARNNAERVRLPVFHVSFEKELRHGKVWMLVWHEEGRRQEEAREEGSQEEVV
jgi:hypothetical protein